MSYFKIYIKCNDFFSGFDRMIPGFPRYFMEGSGEDGYHDLRIENAQLEDDGEFQCQVR